MEMKLFYEVIFLWAVLFFTNFPSDPGSFSTPSLGAERRNDSKVIAEEPAG